jgi:ATP-dependent Lon protease
MPSAKQTVAEKKKAAQRNQKNSKLKKNHDDSDDDENIEIELSDEEEYETCSEDDEDEDEEDEDEEDDDDDASYRPPKSKRLGSKSGASNTRGSSRLAKKRAIEDEDEDDDDVAVDMKKGKNYFHKFLSKLFNGIDEEIADESRSSKKSKKSSKNKRPLKKRLIGNDEDDDEEDEEDEEDEDDDEEDDEEVANKFYNIVFEVDEAEDDLIEESDEPDIDSDDEETFMKESYQKMELPEKKPAPKKKPVESTNKKQKKETKAQTDDNELADVHQEYLELAETKKTLTEQLNKKPNSKILRNAIEECNESIKELVKKARTQNAKTYHSLIHTDKKRTNEIDYFKKKLSNKEQLRIMNDLKEINKHINIEKPYRLALLDSNMPAKFKATALQKLNILRSMDPSDNEYYKIKNWVDTFMRVPFGVYKDLSVKMEDGIDVCSDFMETAQKKLDDCVYGLDDAKLQIMQFVGQWIANPGAVGTAIAIHGPMGSGKTSLVKEGISKILGREFAFIALGGTGDASFLEGHSYTYEGSTWGKIVQILIDSKCMNPVIYFDELDKISDTARGQEIIGILTHLTDTSQNSQFHDKYFAEVDFDLSKCLFIFSYNDENLVNPILRDRMYRIKTKGYDAKEKIIIARNYLLPKIREQVKFNEEDVIIPDETIQYIISNEALTAGEAGVRNLKRCLEIIYTKLNLFRLVKPGKNMFSKEIDLQVTFPFTVNKKELDVLIKNEKTNQSMLAMYV